jgi:hypothetical protein
MVLPVVLYGCERNYVTGDWRKLHDEELHNLYSSPNTVRMIKSSRIRGVDHVTRTGKKNKWRILMGKSEGK